MTEEALTQAETAGIRQASNGSRAGQRAGSSRRSGPSMTRTCLARNADPFVRILRSAGENRPVPQCPGGAAGRNQDIEQGAGRPTEVIMADLVNSAARLDATFEELPGVVWQRHGLRTDGSCRVLPISRWPEVEVHHVDLGLGHGSTECPPELVGLDVPYALERDPERLGDAQRAAFLASIHGRADGPAGFVLRPF